MALFTSSFIRSFRHGRAGGIQALEIVTEAVMLVQCTDIVTLVAEIILLDESDTLSNHTFEWEQTGGPAVTWLEATNQLIVMLQRNTGDNITFRFWVDKGTPTQQYSDTLVTGLARDNITKFSTTEKTASGITVYNPPIQGITNVSLIPGLSADVATQNNTSVTLIWNNPSSTYPLIYSRTEWYDDTLTLIHTFTPTDTVYPGTEHPKLSITYLFRSYYDLYGTGQFEQYTDTYVSFSDNVYLDTGEAVTEFNLRNKTHSGISVFQTQLLELTGLEVSDIGQYNTSTKVDSGISLYQVQLLDLTSVPDVLQEQIAYGLNNRVSSGIAIYQIQVSDGISII